jgi:hypothetical protein
MKEGDVGGEMDVTGFGQGESPLGVENFNTSPLDS